AHHDHLEPLRAALQAVVREQCRDVARLGDAPHERHHDLHDGEAHGLAHPLERPALELEAGAEGLVDVARGAAEAQHPVLLPRCGMLAKSKARSGLPTFIMILTGIGGSASSSICLRSNCNSPSYTCPVSPSAHDTVTSCPSRMRCVASPQPTTAGIPSSRAMMAA